MQHQVPIVSLIYSAPKLVEADPWMAFFPTGLGYIQAILHRHGYSCGLANFTGLSKKAARRYLEEKKPDIVGISMFTFNRNRCFELARIIKELLPDVILVVGGPHPTHLSREVFEECPQISAVVSGEGELPMLEIADRLAKGLDWREAPSLIFRDGSKTALSKPVKDLDSIGFPSERFLADFFDDIDQLGYLITSRGCPAKCAFCNTPEYWGNKVRFRSSSSVIQEMKTLWEDYGLTYFNFRDDTFTTNKSRVLDICRKIELSNIYPLWSCQSRANLIDEDRLVAMVRAGCEFIQIGVEHGSNRILRILDKGIDLMQVRNVLTTVRKVGMNLGIYLITGIPSETMEDVEESVRLIKELLPHDVQISPLAVYPGTRLYSELIASSTLPPDFFHNARDTEVFARGMDEFTKIAIARLSLTAEKIKVKARYTPTDFRQQKKFLGWCVTTNILCGEAAEDADQIEDAFIQYSEIIKHEPLNPWGWLKRALLNAKCGKKNAAKADLREVLNLTPKNREAIDVSRELGLNGDAIH